MIRAKIEGFRMGTEGSGTIIEVGEGVSEEYLNKKVSIGGEAWSTHVIKDPNQCILLDDS